MVSERMYNLGAARSVIRDLFEYGNQRKTIVGDENVFDFSLGNPSVPPPSDVNESIVQLLQEMPDAIHALSPTTAVIVPWSGEILDLNRI